METNEEKDWEKLVDYWENQTKLEREKVANLKAERKIGVTILLRNYLNRDQVAAFLKMVGSTDNMNYKA